MKPKKITACRWMDGGGPEAEVVISSRIRIARNIEGVPFPYLASDAQTRQIQETVAEVAASQKEAFEHFTLLPMENLASLEKELLVEKHLASPFLARESQHGALFLRRDEAVSIMINEEDHIRIQVILPGLQLEEALQEAEKYDDLLEEKINYAFDEGYGYLTACPTNVGTGLRASVMLHLPALIMTGQANRLLGALSQVGLAVRGLYGEGTEIIGNLVQISNQVTLGQSEEEIIRNLGGVTRQVIEQEQTARQAMLNENRARIADRSWRALGLLRYAQIMSSQEAMQLLSDVRLGYDLGLVKGVDRKLLNEMLVTIRPACLQIAAGKELSPSERDLERPERLKTLLEEYKEAV
ncbi:MAG TPA: protein arginine kinase [Firmicutes bacterium]|jgi:protein arginine kinase|nr:protein arginine kinase [Bacillota bacterium]